MSAYRSFAAIAATFLFATGANAASLTYDFFNAPTDGVWEDEKVFIDGSTGITLTVSAVVASDSHVLDFDHDAQVAHWQGYGLGVKSEEDSGYTTGAHQVDATGPNDVAIFELSNTSGYDIVLTSISFSYVDSWDRFDLYLEELGPPYYDGEYAVDDGVGSAFYSTISFGTGIETDAFGIGAAQFLSCYLDYYQREQCYDKKSAFKIKSLTFEITPTTTVPLPAGGGLLLLALGGLAAARRRK